MSVTAKNLFNSQYAPTANTTLYIAPSNTSTIIDKFTATNSSGSTASLSVNIIPSGASVGASNLIIDALSVGAGATVDITQLQNQILAASDQLSVYATAGSAIVVRASGREVS